jgi:flavin-dependent dehydrogenase
MTRANDFFNMLLVSSENMDTLVEKFIRVLKNYAPIQGLFTNIQNSPSTLTPDQIRKIHISKHPVPTFVQDRVVLLGETTGLISACYYEGVFVGLLSAKLAAESMKQLYLKRSTYSRQDLLSFEKQLGDVMLGNFFHSQNASQDMFLSGGPDQLAIWDAYIDAINKDPTVRRNIYLAWVKPDLARYSLENDEYCGEKIYLNLPLGTRLKLTPYFLKLKFSK